MSKKIKKKRNKKYDTGKLKKGFTKGEKDRGKLQITLILFMAAIMVITLIYFINRSF